MHRNGLLAVVALAALAGCGGGDEAARASDGVAITADVTVGTAPGVTVAPVTTDVRGDSAGDEEPTPTTAAPVPSTSPATDAPAEDPTADCMDGQWVADAAEHQRRADALGSPVPMVIGPESVSNVTINDGSFVSDSVVAVSATVGAFTLNASSTSHMEGTFTLDGEVVHADVTVLEETQDDVTATGPDGSPILFPEDAGFEPPAVDPTFEGSTVSCDATAMTFDVVGSQYGTITYMRVG